MSDVEFTAEEQALLEPETETVEEAPEQEASDGAQEGLQEGRQEEVSEEQSAEGDKPPSGYVPYGALKEERQARKELQEMLAKGNERLAQLIERQQPKQPQQVSALEQDAPDPLEDPEGYKVWTQAVRQEIGGMRQAMMGQAQQAQLANHVQADEAQFRQATPDYDAAIAHLKQTRMQELMYWNGGDQAQAMRDVQDEGALIARQALQIGKSPAQFAYELAKMRGYAGKAPAAAQQTPSQAEEKIANITKAQMASKSLGATAGGGKEEITLESLAAMDDDDFAALTDKQWRKAMGG